MPERRSQPRTATRLVGGLSLSRQVYRDPAAPLGQEPPAFGKLNHQHSVQRQSGDRENPE